MKKKLQISLTISLFCLPAVFGFTGCTREVCDCGHINECTCTMRLNTEFFMVQSNEWRWNAAMERYECAFNFDALTQDVIEYSVSQAHVFISEGDAEFTKSLPFVYTYWDATNEVAYTETISHDITNEMITFMLQTSDLIPYENYPPSYEFKFSWIID